MTARVPPYALSSRFACTSSDEIPNFELSVDVVDRPLTDQERPSGASPYLIREREWRAELDSFY